jgi:hypothetical protein
MSMRCEKSLLLHCSKCGGKRPVTLTPEKHYGICSVCLGFIKYSAPRRWRISRRQLLDYAFKMASVVMAALGLIRKPIPVPAPIALKINVNEKVAVTDHFVVTEIS